MLKKIYSLQEVNSMDASEFEAVLGPLFEKSAWIARETWSQRPFQNKNHLLQCLVGTAETRSGEGMLALIRAHPDLAARMQEQSSLTKESLWEQRSAGLLEIPPAEAEIFRQNLAAYFKAFGFPFIVCARLTPLPEILRALEKRICRTPQEEIVAAWSEIQKIAALRLNDLIPD